MPSLCSGGHDAVMGLARCFFCKMVVHFHILFSRTGFGTSCQWEAFRGTSRATAFTSGRLLSWVVMAFPTTSSKHWVVGLVLPFSCTSGHLQTYWLPCHPDCLNCSEPAGQLVSASVCSKLLKPWSRWWYRCFNMLFRWPKYHGDSRRNGFQVAGHTARGVSGGWVLCLVCGAWLWLGVLGLLRFLAPLFTVSPLSKHLGEVERVFWLVPAHRVAMETSLLCLILAWAPPRTFLGTSSQAHLLAISLINRIRLVY